MFQASYPDGTIEKGLWEKGKYLGEEKKINHFNKKILNINYSQY